MLNTIMYNTCYFSYILLHVYVRFPAIFTICLSDKAWHGDN